MKKEDMERYGMIDWNEPIYTGVAPWENPQNHWEIKVPREEVCPHCGRCPVCGRKDEEPKDNTYKITWGYVGAPWIE